MVKAAAILLLILVQLMAMAAGLQLLPQLGGDGGGLLLLGLSFTATLIHEAGHAVVVYAVGAQFRALAVWGIGYDVSARRFGFQRFKGKRELTGYVRYALAKTSANKWSHAWIAAAGPAVNIFAALAAITVSMIEPATTLSGVVTMFAILSAGMAVVNLLPFAGSDGLTIWNAIVRFRRTVDE